MPPGRDFIELLFAFERFATVREAFLSQTSLVDGQIAQERVTAL